MVIKFYYRGTFYKLHTHPKKEAEYGLDSNHVIVDKDVLSALCSKIGRALFPC